MARKEMTKRFWENAHEVSLIGLVASGIGILAHHIIAVLNPNLLAASGPIALTILTLFISSCALVDRSLTKLELLESAQVQLSTSEDAEIKRQAEQEVEEYLSRLMD